MYLSLYELVLGRDGLANPKLTSDCQGKSKCPQLLENVAREPGLRHCWESSSLLRGHRVVSLLPMQELPLMLIPQTSLESCVDQQNITLLDLTPPDSARKFAAFTVYMSSCYRGASPGVLFDKPPVMLLGAKIRGVYQRQQMR